MPPTGREGPKPKLAQKPPNLQSLRVARITTDRTDQVQDQPSTSNPVEVPQPPQADSGVGLLGRTNNDFVQCLQSYLAAGSFGCVFRGSRTAIKISLLRGSTEKQKASLRKEATKVSNQMQTAQCKNIVQTFGFLEKTISEDERSWLVKLLQDKLSEEQQAHNEFFQLLTRFTPPILSFHIEMELLGPTLREWLDASPRTLHNEFVVSLKQHDIAKGIVDGVKYLHDIHIAHRDLKPSNIMFSLGEHFPTPVKIGDFGLIKDTLGSLTASSQVGCILYNSLEPRRSREDHLKGDLFSLGLILYEVFMLPDERVDISLYNVKTEPDTYLQEHKRVPGIPQLVKSLIGRENRLSSVRNIDITIPSQWNISSAVELRTLLTACPNGEVINLRPGTYTGPFDIAQSNITITGCEGYGTTLESVGEKAVLQINGNNCTISKLRILFKMSNPATPAAAIRVIGNNNKLEQLQIVGHPQSGSTAWKKNDLGGEAIRLETKATGTKLFGIKIESMFGVGVKVESNTNELSNITCNDIGHGLWITSHGNTVSVFDYTTQPKRTSSTRGVWVKGGDGNVLGNITSLGLYGGKSMSWALDIMDGGNNEVSNSFLHSTQVSGTNNKFVDVNCGSELHVTGNQHSFLHCQAAILYMDDGTVISKPNCNF